MVLYPNKLPESERVCSGICSLGLTDIPKLFITLFLSCVILNINGCSPLASVLLLKQITEIVTLIILRFTQRFTQQLLYVML